MAQHQSNNALKQRAADLRKLAAKSKFKVGRHVATLMADQCERQAAEPMRKPRSQTPNN
jgi:hypothetical protein